MSTNQAETASALTDSQIVERLAKLVFGWHRIVSIETNDSGEEIRKDWNPLTDWNHWRQVEEKVMEDNRLLHAYINSLVNDAMGDDISKFSGIRSLFEAPLRTRCLALLSALFPHNEYQPNEGFNGWITSQFGC